MRSTVAIGKSESIGIKGRKLLLKAGFGSQFAKG